MKTKSEIIEILNSTELDGMTIRKPTVQYTITDAEVVFAKSYTAGLFRAGRYNRGVMVRGVKVIVKDPVLGSVFFQTTSDKLYSVERGDKISLSLTLTGVGTPTEKYPDPIIFAKANTRKRDSVVVNKPAAEPSAVGDDLPVNV